MDIAGCDTILALDMAQRFLVVNHIIDHLYRVKVIERNSGVEYNLSSVFVDPQNSGKYAPVPMTFTVEHVYATEYNMPVLHFLVELQDKTVSRYRVAGVPIGQKTKTSSFSRETLRI